MKMKLAVTQIIGLFFIVFAESQRGVDIQNRFGFIKSAINEPSPVFLPPQHFSSFLRPDEITGDEMKTFMFAESKPNTGSDYPDRVPESPTSSMLQMIKGQIGQISKSIPSIKAYLLTKELPFPKLNQLTFPLKLELQNGQKSALKSKNPLWSYLKGKSLTLSSDLNEPQPKTKAPLFFLPKGLPIESPIKEEPITLYLNKYSIPETAESFKLSPESEHNDQPVYKEAIGLPAKSVSGLQEDTLDAIQSQYNEQYAKHNQIPTVNLNEFPSNNPAPQTSVNDFYASPYLQNPHIVVTRPYTPTWVPNAKKWYPGTHKSAFYPDTRIIKFTIQDRIYNNSTKKPTYIVKTTPKPSSTMQPPNIDDLNK